MDEALTANSPKFLFAVAFRSVSTTEASDTINVNSRASMTVRLPQLQVQKQLEDFFALVLSGAPNENIVQNH